MLPTREDARDQDWLLTLALTADAAAASGDRHAAATLYPLLLPHAALNVVHFEWLVYLGSAAHWLGLLAELLGDRDAATSHFEAALERNARLGARPALAGTSLAYGRMLVRGGVAAPSTAAARGHSLLRDAALLADALGMAALVHQAQQLAS
jgi:hypothetical protein